jgi:EAL and modified HD-GYP domain-containing signal transduction protein
MEPRTASLLDRQPIMDRRGELAGFRLSWRRPQGTQRTEQAAGGTDLQGLSDLLQDLGPDHVLAGRTGFLEIDSQTLNDLPDLRRLDPARTVVSLNRLHAVAPHMLSRLSALRTQGFGVAVPAPRHGEDPAPWMPWATHLRVDMKHVAPGSEPALAACLARGGLTLIAESVDSPELASRSHALGCHAFQGAHFGAVESMGQIRLGVCHDTVRRALVQATTGAPLSAIEHTFRTDIGLCWRLLRFIASANFGRLMPLDSLRHALMLVGMRRLTRWLRLLLNCVDDVSPAARRLGQSAALRGQLLELLGAEYFAGPDRDNLFLVGGLSMLPALLMQPMSEAVSTLALPDGVADALVARQGRFGALLNLADALEAGQDERVEALCSELSLSVGALARARRHTGEPVEAHRAWERTQGVSA